MRTAPKRPAHTRLLQLGLTCSAMQVLRCCARAGLLPLPSHVGSAEAYGFVQHRGAPHEAYSGALPALSIIQGLQGQAGHAAAAAPASLQCACSAQP